MTSELSFRGMIDKFETVTKVSDWGADFVSAAEKSDKTRPGLIIHLLTKKEMNSTVLFITSLSLLSLSLGMFICYIYTILFLRNRRNLDSKEQIPFDLM